MELWIGTAGYSYPAWVGGFYPPGTKSADYLPEYARHFQVVEINSSFYRPPTAEQVLRMADKVPAGFRFSLKVPRTASHEFDPAELPPFRRAAEALHEAGKLIGLVVQVAESFHNLPSNREWLIRIRAELRPFPLAVEFRHRSWDVPALPGWLSRHGFDVVSVGVPDLPQLFPAGPRVVGGRFYARLHSQEPANWYARRPGPVRLRLPRGDVAGVGGRAEAGGRRRCRKSGRILQQLRRRSGGRECEAAGRTGPGDGIGSDGCAAGRAAGPADAVRRRGVSGTLVVSRRVGQAAFRRLTHHARRVCRRGAVGRRGEAPLDPPYGTVRVV
jgi:uncharacterized protein YecE (DUF72 family)